MGLKSVNAINYYIFLNGQLHDKVPLHKPNDYWDALPKDASIYSIALEEWFRWKKTDMLSENWRREREEFIPPEDRLAKILYI